MKRLLNPGLKTYMAGLLLILAIIGIFQQGYKRVYVQLFLVISVSMVLDFTIRYIKTKEVVFPSSGFITGMIIALVLASQDSWFIPVFASTVAIAQKYIIRYRGQPS